MAQIASLLVPSAAIPQPDSSWLSNLGGTLGGIAQNIKADRSFNGLADRIGGTQPAQQPQASFLSRLTGQPAQQPQTAPVAQVTRSVVPSGNQQEFINSILPAAIEEGKRTGVDPRIIVAQAAQETGWGKSAPGNNLFGIKSHGQSGGNSLMTTEYVNGQPVSVRDSFRGYASPADSVKGYGDFITQNPRYTNFRNAQGLDAQLAELQASGYATDPNYSRSVGAIARGIQLPEGADVASASDAVNAMADGSLASAFSGDGPQPQAQQAIQQAAPNQVAQQGGSNIIAPGVTPIARGSVDPSLIQYMLRDRNLRETGLQLWAANVQGQKASEPWQFVNLPDGTLARANQQTGAVERLGNFAKPNQDAVTVGDNLVDRTTGRVIYEGKPKTPASYQEFKLAQENGFTGTYADWEKVKVPGTSVNVNTGEGDKFYEKLDQKNAENFATIGEQGLTARANTGQVDRLESLLANTPQGAEAAVKQWLGDIGVNTDGLDNIQATRALIEKMVPEQRAPGSGTMSDGDILMFRNSLPRVINQPGGNALIVQTLRGINEYQMKQGEIADAVSDRSITPAEGRKRLRELQNPLSSYRDAVKGFNVAPASKGSSVQRATNPTTGEVLELRNGQWVKVK